MSLTHLHWLPGQNQFYPATRLQLRLGNCSTIGFPNFHHLYLRPEALLYFLPQLSTQKQRGQYFSISITCNCGQRQFCITFIKPQHISSVGSRCVLAFLKFQHLYLQPESILFFLPQALSYFDFWLSRTAQ